MIARCIFLICWCSFLIEFGTLDLRLYFSSIPEYSYCDHIYALLLKDVGDIECQSDFHHLENSILILFYINI